MSDFDNSSWYNQKRQLHHPPRTNLTHGHSNEWTVQTHKTAQSFTSHKDVGLIWSDRLGSLIKTNLFLDFSESVTWRDSDFLSFDWFSCVDSVRWVAWRWGSGWTSFFQSSWTCCRTPPRWPNDRYSPANEYVLHLVLMFFSQQYSKLRKIFISWVQ